MHRVNKNLWNASLPLIWTANFERLFNYLSKYCSRKDKTFWSTVSPFMTDKENKNGGKIILQEGDETTTNNHQIANIFNDYFF